jgi:hypothetical protein
MNKRIKTNRFQTVRNIAKEYGNRFPLMTMVHGYVHNGKYYFAMRLAKTK